MALIDKTYFFGPINIPNTSKTEISERLTWFIEKYEPELLRYVLGLDLYNAFKAGLQEVVVNQKWVDLLYGKEYSYQSRTRRYGGLISVDSAISPGSYYPDDITFSADSTNQSSGEYHLAFLTGKTYRVVQRGVGPLVETTEIVFLSDGFSKVSGFEVGEVFTLQFLAPTVLPTATFVTGVKQSMIANYVYWYWIKDQYTQTVGLGEVAAKAENADNANPAEKLVRAWNDMSEWIYELYYYLEATKDTYTEWETKQYKSGILNRFRKQNLFSL